MHSSCVFTLAVLSFEQGKLASECKAAVFVPFFDKSSAVAEMDDHGHNRHGPKTGGEGALPLSRTAGNPSNTMWPTSMSTSVPSGVFIHPAVWPQYCRMPLAA